MAMDASEIERLIRAGIPDAQVTIRDLAGDGDHYAATVIAASFSGKSRVQQHQLVYQALKGEMGGKLHAWRCRPGRQRAEFLRICQTQGLGCTTGLRYICEQ
jgi:stress-induced morphogen